MPSTIPDQRLTVPADIRSLFTQLLEISQKGGIASGAAGRNGH